MAIITSLLDCDLYKFKMLYFYWKMDMTGQQVTYKLTNRGTIFPSCSNRIDNELYSLKRLKLTYNELEILKKYFPDAEFINWLSTVVMGWDFSYGRGTELSYGGPIESVILYETPIMAILNELHTEEVLEGMGRYAEQHKSLFNVKLITKYYQITAYNKANPKSTIKFVEFGTRRRSSLELQKLAIERAIEIFKQQDIPLAMLGTSNIMLAEQYGLSTKGTIAHEVPMLYAMKAQMKWVTQIVRCRPITHDMYQQLYGMLRESQREFYHDWSKVFPETYYLTDTYGTEWFFRNMPMGNTMLRQDSGSPDLFMDRVRAAGVSKHPFIMFSDGLDVDEMIRIRAKYPEDGITFGWGTNLTNDGLIEPLRIVIKLNALEENLYKVHAVKLSDNPKKATGQSEDISLYKVAFNYPDAEDKEIKY